MHLLVCTSMSRLGEVIREDDIPWAERNAEEWASMARENRHTSTVLVVALLLVGGASYAFWDHMSSLGSLISEEPVGTYAPHVLAATVVLALGWSAYLLRKSAGEAAGYESKSRESAERFRRQADEADRTLKR